MDRDIPAFNRPIMQRIQAKNHELHLKRLKNIKSSISSTKPYQKPTYANLSNPVIDPYRKKYHNLKKDMIEETKNAQIERENALLFKKMVRIMKRPDRNNDPLNRTSVSVNGGKNRLSMEFSRINEENRALFHRLQQQRPTIDVRKLEEERVKNLNILRFLGKYPNPQAQLSSQQSRQKKTLSSLRTGQYYKTNHRNNSYEQYQQQQWRQGIEGYDREVARIRGEMGRTVNGFSRGQTVGNSIGNSNDNRYFISPLYPQDPTTIEPHHYYHPQQPSIPNRKKFLSQGSTRRTMNKFIINPIDTLNDDNNLPNPAQKDTQPYPYYLNHPSHNLALQEMNRHSIQLQGNKIQHYAKEVKPHTAEMKRNYNDRSSNRGNINSNNNNRSNNPNNHNNPNMNQPNTTTITTTNNSINKNIPQRKLNSKNSTSSIITTKLNNNPHPNPHPQQHPQDHHIQQQQSSSNLIHHPQLNTHHLHTTTTNSNRTNLIKLPTPAFTTHQLGEGRQAIATRQLSRKEQVIDRRQLRNQGREATGNNIYIDNSALVNYSVPSIVLYRSTVTLNTLIAEEELDQLCGDLLNELAQQITTPQTLKQTTIQNLKQIPKQLTMSRTPESYLICLTTPHNTTNTKATTHPSLLQLLHNRFLTILSLQIPQHQGSLLLQQINYDYKYFISQMLRVQKDTYDDDMGQHQVGYRLVVGLTQHQTDNDNSPNYNQNSLPSDPIDNQLKQESDMIQHHHHAPIVRQHDPPQVRQQHNQDQHHHVMRQQHNDINEPQQNGTSATIANEANNNNVLPHAPQPQQHSPSQQHHITSHPLSNHYEQALEEQIA